MSEFDDSPDRQSECTCLFPNQHLGTANDHRSALSVHVNTRLLANAGKRRWSSRLHRQIPTRVSETVQFFHRLSRQVAFGPIGP